MERLAESELDGDVSKRIAGSLGSESRRTRETSVDFDDNIALGFGVKTELNVTLSDDTEMVDDLDGSSAEHVVFVIRQCLRRSDDNGFTGVDAHGIEVFHVADGDGVTLDVTNDFVFKFLPALDRFFDENLGRSSESDVGEMTEFSFVLDDARTLTTQGEGGAEHDRVADFTSSENGIRN